MNHDPRYKNPLRVKILEGCIKRYKTDGLNSVKYELISLIKYPMITHLSIDVGIKPENL